MGQQATEPFRTDRWVRGAVGDTLVVDSRDQLLVWEAELPVPRYLFRNEDVRAEHLVPTDAPHKRSYHHPNSRVVAWFDVVVGDRTLRHGAWRREGFEEYTGVTWERGGLDHWYEEDVEVYEHPHDPFVRIDAMPSSRLVGTTRPVPVATSSSSANHAQVSRTRNSAATTQTRRVASL